MFGGDPVIVPTTLYVNVMAPCSYPFVAHTDVPVFRGRHRDNTPVWLLHVMHASGLFAEERITMATAVSWFFDGPGGDFYYWPDGPDGDPQVERSPFGNVAVVADNEFTCHGVGPVGTVGAPSPMDLTLDAAIARTGGNWVVTDGERDPLVYDDATVRVTTSWKAQVFADETEQELVASGAGDISLDAITARFADALDRPVPAEPLTDEAWMDALSVAYPVRRIAIPQ